jgi:hypothetical protein
MKRCYSLLLMVVFLISGCATEYLRDAASLPTTASALALYNRGGAYEPQAYLASNGDLEVFERGLLDLHGDSSARATDTQIELPLDRILRSLTKGQASVKLEVNPKPYRKPDHTKLIASGHRAIPVRRIIPDAALPLDANTVYLLRKEGCGCVPDYDWINKTGWEKPVAIDITLVDYLERQPSDPAVRQELLYMADRYRRCWIWYERDGLLNDRHFVLTFWEYPPPHTRWYLYAFAPITVAFDLVTSPIQIVVFLYIREHFHF